MANMDFDDQMDKDDLSQPDVYPKYKIACEIVNFIMPKLIEECKAGKKVVDLCKLGDSLLEARIAKMFPIPKGQEEEHEAGIAFPTCISTNANAGHVCPLQEDTSVIAGGDMLKIDMGVHIDGFVSVAAQTILVPGGDTLLSDRRADVITAAYAALQTAARLIRPGNKNTDVSKVIAKVASIYGVSACEGVLSHGMGRYMIDGERTIMNHPTTEQHTEEVTFEPLEAWNLDIVMSTGEGKLKDAGNTRPTIFKRNQEVQYLLKLKASKYLMQEVNHKFPVFPFCLRSVGDEKRAKLGVTELVSHGMLDPYPVLCDKTGEFVAQFKATVLVHENGTCIATAPFLPVEAKSTLTAAATADEMLRAAMATDLVSLDKFGSFLSTKKKSKKSKKSKAKKESPLAAPATTEGEKVAEVPSAEKKVADAPAGPLTPDKVAPTFTEPTQRPTPMEVDKKPTTPAQ